MNNFHVNFATVILQSIEQSLTNHLIRRAKRFDARKWKWFVATMNIIKVFMVDFAKSLSCKNSWISFKRMWFILFATSTRVQNDQKWLCILSLTQPKCTSWLKHVIKGPPKHDSSELMLIHKLQCVLLYVHL